MDAVALEGRGRGSFDPPLVRGRDGHLYFVVAGLGYEGEISNYYIPAQAGSALNRGDTIILYDEDGKDIEVSPREDGGDLADIGIRGGFHAIRTLGERRMGIEGRYGGRVPVYVPLEGLWFRIPGDVQGRTLFAVKAAIGRPDSRLVSYVPLDNLLWFEQTYEYGGPAPRRRWLNEHGAAVAALFLISLFTSWFFSLLWHQLAAMTIGIMAIGIVVLVYDVISGRVDERNRPPYERAFVPEVTPPVLVRGDDRPPGIG